MDDEDTPCDVCKSPEVENEDKIIFCDKCNVAVHQACYGIVKIPIESWFCKTCEQDIQPTCVFCLQDKGAMKTTTDGKWAHVNCTLWIPEVNFADPETMDNIQNLDKIPKSRWSLSCFICRKKGGACIQCYVPSCKTAYHVSCAYKSGLHMRMEDVVTSESEIIFESFCRKHTGKRSFCEKSIEKKKKNSNDGKIFDQFLPNPASTDASTKAHRDSQFRSYLEGLKAEMKSNLQHNISEVNMLSKDLEKNLVPQSTTYKKASGPEITNKTNGNDDKVVENEFSFNLLINTATKKENENTNRIAQKVMEPTVTSNENGKQTQLNKTEDFNDVSNRAYIGTTLVAKATARKSFAVLNKMQSATPNNKVAKKRQLVDILPKTVKSAKAPNKSKAKVAKPKAPPKRKANPSSAANNSKTPAAKLPKLEEQAQSKITIQNVTLTPQNGSTLNYDQNLSPETVATPNNCPPWLGPWGATSMKVAAVMQNQPSSSTEICVPMSSNSHNLNAFLGYLASLLQSLPAKKSLKVQRKLITQVLKEHNLSSSSSDEISDVSSMSD